MESVDRVTEFKQYFETHLDAAKAPVEKAAKDRDEFVNEYPLSRLSELSVDEYCLGTAQSKDSLCYLLEFGKYKHTGFGIGGGSAKKYGVYYNKADNSYKHGADLIENIEEFWPLFRENLCRFLTDSGSTDNPVILEDYPLLHGMAMVLTKLLCLYFPQKYFSIGSYSVLKDLMDRFHYTYDENMRCHQLNYYFYKNIRADLPEVGNYDGLYLGCMAWDFIQGKPSGQKGKKESALGDAGVEEHRYWLYSPGDGAVIWNECYKNGIMAIGWDEIGDLRQYSSKTAMKEAMKAKIDPELAYTMGAHATWQFSKEMKPGDIVFAKRGRSTVIGRGVVLSDYEFDDTRKEYKNIRKVNWTHKGEWPHPGQAAMKTLTDITSYTDYVEQLNALFETEDIDDSDEKVVRTYPDYSEENFLAEVFMDEEAYETLAELVLNKKNVILQGAPGVGKTFAAKRLAYSIMGVKDPNRVMMVQFHQSYSYEDFIMGFRPSASGFELKRGGILQFLQISGD